MGKLLILDIGNNVAAFGMEGDPQQQQGLIYWTNPVHKDGNNYSVDISGRNTEGVDIFPSTVEIEVEGNLNPTKVFWAIYKVLDKIVCPNCEKHY